MTEFAYPDTKTVLEQTAQNAWAEGDFIYTGDGLGGFLVAGAAAPDSVFDVQAANNAKLFAIPSAIGLDPRQFGVDVTGATVSTAQMKKCMDKQMAINSLVTWTGSIRIDGRIVTYSRDLHASVPRLRGHGRRSSRLLLEGEIPDFVFSAYGTTGTDYVSSRNAGSFMSEGFSIEGSGSDLQNGEEIQNVFDVAIASYGRWDEIWMYDCRGYNMRFRQVWEGLCGVFCVRGGDCVRLKYDGGTGEFTPGEIVTNGAGASAQIAWYEGSTGAGTLFLTGPVTGTFADGDTLTGNLAGAATCNGGQYGSEISPITLAPYFDENFNAGQDMNIGESGCNNLTFPDWAQVEAPFSRAIYAGPGTRKVKWMGKVHPRLQPSGAFVETAVEPILMDGARGFHVTNRANISWNGKTFGARIRDYAYPDQRPGHEGETLTYKAADNSVLDSRISGVIIESGARNTVEGNIGSVPDGQADFVVVEGGDGDNKVGRNQIASGDPYAQFTLDWAFTGQFLPEHFPGIVRIGPTPSIGWKQGPVHISAGSQDDGLVVTSNDNTCRFLLGDNSSGAVLPGFYTTGTDMTVRAGGATARDVAKFKDNGNFLIWNTFERAGTAAPARANGSNDTAVINQILDLLGH